jgi:uncharacterized protein DUF4367
VNCASCGQTTKPLRIGGEDYCSNCGNLYHPGAGDAAATKPAPAPRGVDLSTRRQPVVSARRAAPKAAGALHHRASDHHVIDLRQSPAPRPEPSPKPRAITAPAIPSNTPIVHKASGTGLSDRLGRAKQITRSPAIDRFARTRLPDARPEPTPSPTPSAPAAVLPHHTATQHAAMARLTPLPPVEPAPTKPHTGRHHLTLSAHHRRLATTAAAVVLMGGYIWLNNYPKLAIQNADAKAGISATMPGFIPSSYTLARTNTSPGAITLKFTSPSDTQALTIAQQRTNWDANSLLDDYVSQAADDYAAINGQGLTIYLYGNDNATWVNHGLWYQIEGASQLSRDQILKIAYSL